MDKETRLSRCHHDFALVADSVPPRIDGGWIRSSSSYESDADTDGKSDINVTLLKSQMNYRENESRKLVSQYPGVIDSHRGRIQWMTEGLPQQVEGSMKPSPSGNRIAVIRSKTKNSTTTFRLEIWGRASLLQSFDLSQAHGDILTDDWFGALNWSPDERFVTYVAKPKPSSTASGKAWWDNYPELVKVKTEETSKSGQGAEQDAQEKDSQCNPNKGLGDRFHYKEDWGERFNEVTETRIFIASVESGRIIETPLPAKTNNKGEESDGSDDPTVGQPVFSACGKWIFYVLWWPLPYRLGIIYCFHRPCAIFAMNVSELQKTVENKTISDQSIQLSSKPQPTAPQVDQYCISPQYNDARSPRPSPCGRYIAFLTNGSSTQVETHNSTTCVQLIQWEQWLANGKSQVDSQTLEESNWPLQTRYAGKRGVFVASISMTVLCPVIPGAVQHDDDFVEWTKKFAGDSESVDRDLIDRLEIGFPGVYAISLPSRCWSEEGTDLYFTSDWGSKSSIVRIQLHDGKLQKLSGENDAKSVLDQFLSHELFERCGLDFQGRVSNWNDQSLASVSVLDVCESLVLFSASSPSIPSVAGVLAFDEQGNRSVSLCAPLIHDIADKAITPHRKEMLSEILCLHWTCFSVSPSSHLRLESRPSDSPFESILIVPSDTTNKRVNGDKPTPLLVMIHGGPHGADKATFSNERAFLCTQGFAVLSVNYRGSTGFGEQSVRFLPGRCGAADVNDCVDAIEEALKKQLLCHSGYLSSNHVSVHGGSHGGFLGAHLSAQFPDKFTCATLRNPVIDIAGEANVTDIPDWYVNLLTENLISMLNLSG